MTINIEKVSKDVFLATINNRFRTLISSGDGDERLIEIAKSRYLEFINCKRNKDSNG